MLGIQLRNDTPPVIIPKLEPITVKVRELDAVIWALMAKEEPLTAEEWEYLEERERQGS